MDKDEAKAKAMLTAEYTITLNGGMLGYILKLLADEQHILNEDMAENITNPMAALLAAANDMVGNTLLHEAYRAAGADFLAYVMNANADGMRKLMEANDHATMAEAAKEMGLKPENMPKRPKGSPLN